MSFDIINHVLASEVATSGTVTLSYPAGKTPGHYEGAVGHTAQVMGAKIDSPAGFTLTFNAGDITFTYLGTTTIPANAKIVVQVEEKGEADGQPDDVSDINNAKFSPPVLVNLGAPDTADPNGYIESQDLTAAGVFSVDTTVAAALLAAALDGSADVPRNVVAAWTTTAVLTVTGTDEYGKVLVESSPSGTSFTGKKAFKTVTNVETSVDITSLTVGTGDVLGLPSFLPATSHVLAELVDDVVTPRVTRIPWQVDETDLLAGTPISIPSPVAGVISRLTTMAWKAVTTGGDVTMKVNNVSVDGLTVTVADGGGAGDFDADVPTAGHSSTIVAVDDELEINFDAAFATAGALTGYIELVPGTIVKGDDTDPTATTGDVRGTYDPAAAADGSLGFQLLVALPDPAYKGLAQFAG